MSDSIEGQPEIAILMATYNGEKYIGQQIQSIQEQTYEHWKLLISDDCSTDETLNIVREYAANDSRIKIISKGRKHGGAKENFMFLINNTDAPYVAFADQDDYWLADKLRSEVHRMIEEERENGSGTPILVVNDMKVADEDLSVLHESFNDYSNINPKRNCFQQVLAQNIAAGCCMLANRSLIEYAKKKKDIEGIIMHDWWLALLASGFGKIEVMDEPLSLYRQHASNTIGAKRFLSLERVKNVAFAFDRIQATLDQAVAFRASYGAQLDSEKLLSIERYTDIPYSSFPKRLINLLKSGVWKTGVRKLIQIVCIVFWKSKS